MDRITGFLSQYILIALLAVVVGFLMTLYTIKQPIEFKLGVTIVTDKSNELWQFYCHSDSYYRGEMSTQAYYTKALEVSPDTYRITLPIVCGSEATHLRFDPLPDVGEVTIQSMRIHTHDWRWVDLDEAFKYIKPINSVSHVELTDAGIQIKSVGHDPHLELANNLQDYIATTWQQFVKFTLKFSAYAFVLLGVVKWLVVMLLSRADQLLNLGQKINQQLASSLSKGARLVGAEFVKRYPYSWLIALSVGVLYALSATMFTSHMNIKPGGVYAMVWGSMFCHVWILFSLYTLVLRLLQHAYWARYVLGYLLIMFSVYLTVDVSLYTLNGMHADHGIGMLFYGGLGAFINNLRFTGLPTSELAVYVFIVVVLILSVLFFVYWIEKRTQKLKFSLTGLQSLVILAIAVICINGSQKWVESELTGKQIANYENHFLFGLSFYQYKPYLVSFPTELKPFKRQDKIKGQLAVKGELKDNDIYLFIFESLRSDMVSAEIMPHLSDFKKESLYFEKGVASGNATHYGWYSIINGLQPFYWDRYRNVRDKKGSLPLQIFKALGYQINVYTAKDLSYLGSDKIMFGESLQAVDYISDHPDLSPPEHDVRISQHLISDVRRKHPHGKYLNLVFLDSSHYPYSWLDQGIEAIEPYDGDSIEGPDVSKAKRLIKKDKRLVMNRYKNSMKFMDYLFNQVVQAIEKSPSQNESVIAIVGDHGQQFMEHGYMLHGFTLFDEDIDVPIYFKFPDEPAGIKSGVAAQVDIMPTLLEYIGVNTDHLKQQGQLAGHDLLSVNTHQFALSSVAGEQNTPFSYALVSPQWKVLFKTEQKRPTDSKFIHVVRVLDQNDQDYLISDESRAAYKQFINQQFPDFLKQIDIFQ